MTSYVREFGAEMRLRVGFGSESERPGRVGLCGVIKGKAKGRETQRRPSVIGEDGGGRMMKGRRKMERTRKMEEGRRKMEGRRGGRRLGEKMEER